MAVPDVAPLLYCLHKCNGSLVGTRTSYLPIIALNVSNTNIHICRVGLDDGDVACGNVTSTLIFYVYRKDNIFPITMFGLIETVPTF